MKTRLAKLLLIVSLILPMASQAKSMSDLINEVTTATASGDTVTLISSSSELLEKFLDQDRIDDAFKLGQKISNATNPVLMAHGYLLLSRLYSSLFSDHGNSGYALESASFLILSGENESTLQSVALFAESIGEGFDSFYTRAKAKAETFRKDKLLNESMGHVINGRWDLVKKYISNGLLAADYQRSSDGVSLLHVAAWHGKYIVARELIEIFSVDVNAETHNGQSPLSTARDRGQDAIYNLLKVNGAEL